MRTLILAAAAFSTLAMDQGKAADETVEIGPTDLTGSLNC